MSGIIGYIGNQPAVPVLLKALTRLEYRGYDSAGLARLSEAGVVVTKSVGRVAALASRFEGTHTPETLGIAHTRWATHGAANEANAHPHIDCTGKVAVVHNGVIENYQFLKKKLQDAGHVFRSETDSEVLAHLIETQYRENLSEAVRLALLQVRGTYALAVIAADQPNVVVAARSGSPLMLGVGDGEYFVASDLAAVLPFTDKVVPLSDGELVRISREGYRLVTLTNIWVDRVAERAEFLAEKYEQGHHPHFILKEILEIPEVIRKAAFGRVLFEEGIAHFGGLNLTQSELRAVQRLVVVGSGSAYHAALLAQHVFEEWAGIPVRPNPSSEFRYRRLPLTPDTLGIVISASGETADTIASLREMHRSGIRVCGISNVATSTLTRETDGGILINAGPELGVPSTKTLLGQATVLTLWALLMGRLRGMSLADGRTVLSELGRVPSILETCFARREIFAPAVALLKDARVVLYHGRKSSYPVALEGALKMKECALMPAEAFAAGEVKHGPLALVQPDVPSVVLIPKDSMRDSMLTNMEELRTRGSRIVAFMTEGDEEAARLADVCIPVPQIHEMIQPLVYVPLVQLLAYELGVARGCDVDKPRHLAKSVIVE